jgi:hypothetical protein
VPTGKGVIRRDAPGPTLKLATTWYYIETSGEFEKNPCISIALYTVLM